VKWTKEKKRKTTKTLKRNQDRLKHQTSVGMNNKETTEMVPDHHIHMSYPALLLGGTGVAAIKLFE